MHTQQSRIQMMMTAMDAPGWFLHKAIPPHQPLGGRVQPSQHNIHKNVAVRAPPCAPRPLLPCWRGGVRGKGGGGGVHLGLENSQNGL